MNANHFSKVALGVIALSLFAIAVERPTAAPAATASPAVAEMPYSEIEFVPQGSNGFIAVNRRTGDFSWYQLGSPNNQWKWEKLGPTGHLQPLGTPPTTAP